MWDEARAQAGVLRGHGDGPGDRVAVLVPDTPVFPAAYYGVLALGATVVPLNVQLRAFEIELVLRDSGVRALICDESVLAEGAPGRCGRRGTALHCGGRTPRRRRPRHALHVGDHRPPQGAMLTHCNVIANIEVTAVSPFPVE
ncbi:AMP-binding protein [Streptomyces sp. NPDC054833]